MGTLCDTKGAAVQRTRCTLFIPSHHQTSDLDGGTTGVVLGEGNLLKLSYFMRLYQLNSFLLSSCNPFPSLVQPST